MALPWLIAVLVLALAFSSIELSSCSSVKGSILCTDCGPDYDFSGIRVLVKCDKVKKLSMAIATSNGGFTADLPSVGPTAAARTSPNCLAKLLDGRTQLYAWKKDMVSKIVMVQGDDENNTYTLLYPLTLSKSCPGKCNLVGSSKTIDLPIPPEYGLPPTSYYTPGFPIIGIP